MKELTYKNFKGTIEYSKEDKIFFGKITNIKDLVFYKGKNLKELKNNFELIVNDYIFFIKRKIKNINSLQKITYINNTHIRFYSENILLMQHNWQCN